MSHNSRSAPHKKRRKQPVQGRSRATVATILEAAAHVLVQRGHAGFTTNHVAERAGVSIGSIYQYFHDKDALLVALTSRTIVETEQALLTELSGLHERGLSTPAYARALVRVWSTTHAEAHHPLLYAISSTLPEVRERGEAAVQRVAQEVAEYLRSRGVSAAPLRARIIVVTALSLVHEVVMMLPSGASRRAAEREAARMVEAYMDSVIPSRTQARAEALHGPGKRAGSARAGKRSAAVAR